jgi:DNA polymerase III sliding clamp (beta) subunit (PCNA family)
VEVCIPRLALTILNKVLPADGTLGFGKNANGNKVVFICGPLTVVAQLIEGAYPDLDPQLKATDPKNAKVTATCKLVDLKRALKTVDVFAREAAHTVRLTFSEQPDEARGVTGPHIRLQGTSAETGASDVNVPAEVKGSMEIAANTHYLMDYTSIAEGEDVAFHLVSPTSPFQMRPVEKSKLISVIMPMHLGK